jgi:S1-C subfamily serine protease
MALAGFGKALSAALEIHRQYPANQQSLMGKRAPEPQYRLPEDYPSLRGQYAAKLDYEGKVVESCMHCHQIRDAERLVYRTARQPIPDNVLFPWPTPDVIGLALDPQQKAKVLRVASESSAARAGFAPGDEILALEGQPILSIADVQWVLHHAAHQATLTAEVMRDGKRITLALHLEPGWRPKTDIGWRVSTWELRRMATGGLVLEAIPAADRRAQGLGEQMALAVRHVGEYGDHAVAKRAGFRQGDILVGFDGRTDLMSEVDLIAYAVQNRMPAEQVPVDVLRDGKRLELVLPMQ